MADLKYIIKYIAKNKYICLLVSFDFLYCNKDVQIICNTLNVKIILEKHICDSNSIFYQKTTISAILDRLVLPQWGKKKKQAFKPISNIASFKRHIKDSKCTETVKVN